MPGLSNYDCEGTLAFDGISMNRSAWAILGDQNGNGGLFQLLTTVDLRGEDRVVPGSTGVIAYPRRQTATRYSFRLLVTGEVDETGAVNADPINGLADNLDYLWTNVLAPVVSATGTRTAVWTKPDTTTVSSAVHIQRCEPIRYGLADRTVWEGRLVISSPGGRFS